MRIEPGQPIFAVAMWAQEWQRLSWTTINQALGHYLHGCANLAMTGTPQQALAALHKIQAVLLRHSAETFAEATRLWRKQNTELPVMPAEHARAPAIGRQLLNDKIYRATRALPVRGGRTRHVGRAPRASP